jgi:hypothetical protein
MLALSDKWAKGLVSQPETGMGYQIATIVLHDGRQFEQAVIEGGYITKIRGQKSIPFAESDMAQIIITHDKWDFRKT